MESERSSLRSGKDEQKTEAEKKNEGGPAEALKKLKHT